MKAKTVATNSDKSTKKHFDISRPGKSAPNSNSRSIIVGHHAVLQDPMMVKSQNDSSEPAPVMSPLAGMSSIKLTPSEEIVTEQKAVENAEITSDKEVVNDQIDTEAKPEEQAENASTAITEPQIETQDSINDDDKELPNSDTGSEEQKQIDMKAKEQEAKQEAINNLINEKTYFVQIGEKRHKRSRHHVIPWTIVIIILLLATADLMIDAGIIKTSIKPPISFFQDK